MSTTLNDQRVKSNRLRNFFGMIVNGKRAIRNMGDGKLFLEAICDQEDRTTCIEGLVAAPQGLQALKMSLRVDTSSAFINHSSANFLRYIAVEGVRQLCGGQLLQDVLITVTDPPTFWNALKACYRERSLSHGGQHAFACLLELLCSLPSSLQQGDVFDVAEKALIPGGGLLDSSDRDIRTVAYKIQGLVRGKASGASAVGTIRPGGRHDNDFEDFRKIAIFPTADELLAKVQPFYLPADAVMATESETRVAVHLDNQYRLLRDDMLEELRTDLQIGLGNKQGKRASLRLGSLVFHGIDTGTDQRRKSPTLALRCYKGLPRLSLPSKEERKKYYAERRTFLKHQSFGCLLCRNEIIAFATIDRDEDRLAEDPPIILLRIFGDTAMVKTLITFKTVHQQHIEFILVDTPFFAYEPVLRCLQEKSSVPLSDELLKLAETGETTFRSPFTPEHVVEAIKQNKGRNLRNVLKLPFDVILDHSQTVSVVAGLSQTVSAIQGPPGTGKSFLGAIITKALYETSNETILILCYTNHALDQFLEDILDIGVPDTCMLRLGSKSTQKTQNLGLHEQSGGYRRSRNSWSLLNMYDGRVGDLSTNVQKNASSFRNFKVSEKDVLEYLQFSDNDFDFFRALSTPETEDDMAQVDRKGKAINSSYLLKRWLDGLDAGVFKSTVGEEYKTIWGMGINARLIHYQRWSQDFVKERAIILQDAIQDYDESYDRLSNVRNQKHAETIQNKRIIGCTTTAAAKYTKELLNANPGIIIVEEAGEILESHVLSALSVDTKHLVLIGDHRQLRPKINNYALTVEQGNGYNLNVSLFERLVLSGYPHTTLNKQHRMRPEISALVRRLMYPDLQDDAKTLNRPNIRGLQSNVVFINHSVPEERADNVADKRDDGSKVSRENIFEAKMVLKIVRYLAQQGYGTDKQVVLTPYLGQLGLLMKILQADHDPVLSDLDSFDLVRAGLLPPASAKTSKKALKISTIDNYQGEESDIVIVCLTRSNNQGDIGFMVAPQRLNVLLSRARDGLLLLGNAKTFASSRKGGQVWKPFFDQLSKAGQLYDGLPVKCERHPQTTALLRKVEDFDMECPDGGCLEPCQTKLNCGKHACPQRCHQLSDHSKVQCTHIMQAKCPENHKITWECWRMMVPCRQCEAVVRKREERKLRNHKLDQEREVKERAYAQRLSEIDDEIEHERRLQKEHADERDMTLVMEQRKNDLASLRAATRKVHGQNEQDVKIGIVPITQTSGPVSPTSKETTVSADASDHSEEQTDEQLKTSQAGVEWEYQKKFQNADSEHLDALMDMIGLESVKQQVLTVKTKIDTCIRQGAGIKEERFGVALLGNPGTGKTTVARLYAKFLSSVGVISGTDVRETTGARLASEGVPACKKLIEDVLSAGGGAIFIDEAYQLVSGTTSGALDFLLAEVENLTGKVVFILAGYNKQMEGFFAHNPGLPSRFPHTFQFQDYDDNELQRILEYKVKKRFQGRMKVENGLSGIYCRIVVRRIGRGRGREGFGNARAVENVLSQVLSRQALRLAHERRTGKVPDDMFLTQQDLIGPEPSNALEGNKSWEKLKRLTGLKAVKLAVHALFDSIQFNYERELDEEPLLEFNLNRIFLGPPGTGKTTVAKLYGQILADIGLLSNGEVVVKNPSDFVGDVLGASERITKGILASTVGKVLVIDEAYGLSGSSSGGGVQSDPFRKAVIDTIVAEVQSSPGDDRCVLLLGYKSQMESMFQNENSGLSRRFPLSEAFQFEDFNLDELKEILEMKLKDQGYKATDQALRVATEVLGRARNRPNFGNAGEVDILLNGAKARHQQRRSTRKIKGAATLEAVDIDPDFDRDERAATNIRMLFEGVVGCEQLVEQLEGYQRTVANMKARDMDPREQIPFNLLFRGPPGTGKTTTARKIGKIYYDMGFLATAEVVETSATDLVGEFVGQTGPKTQKLLEKALGKVLFIDEAYRLAEGQFAKEAMDEIVDRLTKPEFSQRLVVILAGYDADINRLMSINPGLTSRFPETVTFASLSPLDCLTLFTGILQKKGKAGKLDISVLESPSTAVKVEVLNRFEKLTNIPNWANARDIGTLAKSVFGKLLQAADPTSKDPIRVDIVVVLEALDAMITERKKRAIGMPAQLPSLGLLQDPRMALATKNQIPPLSLNIGQETHLASPSGQELIVESPLEALPDIMSEDPRDLGVNDEVWTQLNRDKQTVENQEKEYNDLLERQAELKADHKRKQEEEQESMEEKAQSPVLDVEHGKQKQEEEDAKERLEKERLRLVRERRRREEQLAIIEEARQRAEEERKKEVIAQSKLRSLGVCVAGFRWVKQNGGYRCAGGTHFVSDAELR